MSQPHRVLHCFLLSPAHFFPKGPQLPPLPLLKPYLREDFRSPLTALGLLAEEIEGELSSIEDVSIDCWKNGVDDLFEGIGEVGLAFTAAGADAVLHL